jgi:hypothetical protein
MKTYLLISAPADLTRYDDIPLPRSGPVVDPKWSPDPSDDGHLEGLVMGEFVPADTMVNMVTLRMYWGASANWLILEAEADELVWRAGWAKAPRGEIVFCGPYEAAVSELTTRGANPARIVGARVGVGHRRIALAPWNGQAIAGDGGIAVAQGDDQADATAGTWGIAVAGSTRHSTARAETYGVAVSGPAGASSVGAQGIAITWEGGVAEAGSHGIAIANPPALAIAGDFGIALGSDARGGTGGVAIAAAADGVASAGEGGALIFRHWDAVASRFRWIVAYPGEDGVMPDTPYSIADGKLVRAEP